MRPPVLVQTLTACSAWLLGNMCVWAPLQVCAAETLGSLAGQHRVDVVDAGGIKKLRELASDVSTAPQAVKAAAQQALTNAGA